ncbi:hypothetical protein IT774_11750 [Salinimonas marina]|uniref:Uncharacterized protein n=1 Tax=Salinimonas marina TaxID=2785918 RepID=A0A7S9DVR8_9ALTE|nr:hypothetical protein [Salinimonas marina]QPG04841.1 hypothetical protein IT774_11750 [Salinimonas marina]
MSRIGAKRVCHPLPKKMWLGAQIKACNKDTQSPTIIEKTVLSDNKLFRRKQRLCWYKPLSPATAVRVAKSIFAGFLLLISDFVPACKNISWCLLVLRVACAAQLRPVIRLSIKPSKTPQNRLSIKTIIRREA